MMESKTVTKFDRAATAIAKSTGTLTSLVIHTVLIAAILSLYLFGVNFNTVLLTLTTLLSVETIYLQIFNQLINNKLCEASEADI